LFPLKLYCCSSTFYTFTIYFQPKPKLTVPSNFSTRNSSAFIKHTGLYAQDFEIIPSPRHVAENHWIALKYKIEFKYKIYNIWSGHSKLIQVTYSLRWKALTFNANPKLKHSVYYKTSVARFQPRASIFQLRRTSILKTRDGLKNTFKIFFRVRKTKLN